MKMVDPYSIIKQANQPSTELLEKVVDEKNTSLDKGSVRDGRESLVDEYIDNRLRSDKPITFLSFIDDLRSLWEAAGKEAKIIRQQPVKEEAQYPVITYRVLRRIVNEGFKDKKPRYRTTIRHPYMNDEYIELYGQIFDIWVEFCVYSTSAEEADELVMELEEFLQTYAGFFKAKGVQEILFHAQSEDEVLSEGRVMIAKRKIQYTMRFEKIIVRFLNEIQSIALQAKLLHEEKNN